MKESELLKRIRVMMVIIMIGLFISGVTAFPLETELVWLSGLFGDMPIIGPWLHKISEALVQTNGTYPFLAYGTDWLAFAHIILAVLFIGPYIDPVKNKWVIQFGIIACLGVLPLALLAGPIRGIPFYWQLIDSSFGVLGIIPLLFALKWVRYLESEGSRYSGRESQ